MTAPRIYLAFVHNTHGQREKRDEKKTRPPANLAVHTWVRAGECLSHMVLSTNSHAGRVPYCWRVWLFPCLPASLPTYLWRKPPLPRLPRGVGPADVCQLPFCDPLQSPGASVLPLPSESVSRRAAFMRTQQCTGASHMSAHTAACEVREPRRRHAHTSTHNKTSRLNRLLQPNCYMEGHYFISDHFTWEGIWYVLRAQRGRTACRAGCTLLER